MQKSFSNFVTQKKTKFILKHAKRSGTFRCLSKILKKVCFQKKVFFYIHQTFKVHLNGTNQSKMR